MSCNPKWYGLPIPDKGVLYRIKWIRCWSGSARIKMKLHVGTGPASCFKIQSIVQVNINGEISQFKWNGELVVVQHTQCEIEVSVTSFVVYDRLNVGVKLGVGVTFGG